MSLFDSPLSPVLFIFQAEDHGREPVGEGVPYRPQVGCLQLTLLASAWFRVLGFDLKCHGREPVGIY